MGADHDGSGAAANCPVEDDFLMGPTLPKLGTMDVEEIANPFTLSACSIKSIGDCLDGRKTDR